MYKEKKKKLEKHGGCEDCTKRCQRNGDVAFPEVAKLTKGKKFVCNNSRQGFEK